MVGEQYGKVKIISAEILRKNDVIHVQCQCTECAQVRWINFANLRSGKTRGCQHCTQTKHVRLTPAQRVLGGRYDAILQRCTNPADAGYKYYGARGIRLLFSSRREFIAYVQQALPHPTYKGVEIDRAKNNGHYAPGNLRLATRAQQMRNQRGVARTRVFGKTVSRIEAAEAVLLKYPDCRYELQYVVKLLREGLSPSQIRARYLTMGARSSRHKGRLRASTTS